MKRGSQNRYKMRSQAIQYRQETHYERVQAIGMESLHREQRTKRIDVLVKKGISKKTGLKMPGGITVPIRSITMQGIIVLYNFDEIDPLDL